MKTIKQLVHKLFLRLPDNVHINKIHKLLLFWVAHRRMPRRNSGLFSDYLFFLRADYDRDPDLPLRRRLTNKLAAKDYCRSVLGKDIAPATLRIFNSASEIEDGIDLPRCIIKPAHAGGSMVIYHDGGALGAEQAATIRSWFDYDIYRDVARLPNFKNIEKSVFCEEIVAPPEDIADYRAFCRAGHVRAFIVDVKGLAVGVKKWSDYRRRLYTSDWEPLPYSYTYPLAPVQPKPVLFDEMVDYASRLTAGIEFIRVDFYLARGQVWFGEFGNYHAAGNARFETQEAERHFSRLILG